MKTLHEKTFEEFLREAHTNIFESLLDDDMPDHFDNWLGELDGEDYINFGELYGSEKFNEGMQHILNIQENK